MADSGPARYFYVPLNTIVLRSWMENRKYTAADARRDAALGGISEWARSGAHLSYYRPEDIAWVMPNFMQWLPVAGFKHENSVKGLHELSRGETRINNLGAPVSHGCLRLTRYGAVLARWWTPRGRNSSFTTRPPDTGRCLEAARRKRPERGVSVWRSGASGLSGC